MARSPIIPESSTPFPTQPGNTSGFFYSLLRMALHLIVDKISKAQILNVSWMTPLCMSFGTTLLVVVVALIGYGLMAYSALVRQRNQVKEAWCDFDVRLKHRYNLIPNFISWNIES